MLTKDYDERIIEIIKSFLQDENKRYFNFFIL